MYAPIPTALGQNILEPHAAKPYLSYREGVGEVLAENILRDKKQQTIESHASDLETADVSRDSVRTSTQKMIQDLAHDKSENQIKDTFKSLMAASTLPIPDQNIYLDNLIEDYNGNGRFKTVLKYMRQNPNEDQRAALYGELNDVGVKGGYLEELYSEKYASGKGGTTNLQRYVDYRTNKYIEENGKEPPASSIVTYAEDFQKLTPRSAYVNASGKANAEQDATLSDKGDKVRDTEVTHEGNVSESKESGTLDAKIKKNTDLIHSTGDKTANEKQEEARGRMSKIAKDMYNTYLKLDELGEVINTNKSPAYNLVVKGKVSKPGQAFAAGIGGKGQSYRQDIMNYTPLLLEAMRKATQMGATQVNTDRELAFYSQAAGDVTRDLQSNLAALSMLEGLYGTGVLKDMNLNIDPQITANLKVDWEEEKRRVYYGNINRPEDMNQSDWDNYYKRAYGTIPEEK